MLRGLNHCRGQHAQAKECGGSNEHRPSANTIGNNAQEHRTKQHTNEPGAENGTESCRVDVPIMCQGGCDKSMDWTSKPSMTTTPPIKTMIPFWNGLSGRLGLVHK